MENETKKPRATPRKSKAVKASDFATELRKECGSWAFNPTFLERWYAEIITSLRSARERCSAIKHPKSRGDAIEAEVLLLLNSIFPKAIQLQRGFGVSRLSTPSREQDILVLDSHRAISIVNSKSEPYFPIEGVFGSFGVKSNLTLDEIRSSFINCASIKKLQTFFKEGEEAVAAADAINYCVIALNSPLTLENVADRANGLVDEVVFHLLPDSIWILGKGLVLKGDDTNLLQLRSRQDLRTRYKTFTSLNVSEDDLAAHSFLWAILSMIQHCEDRRQESLLIDYLSYLSYPFSMRQMTEKAAARRDEAERKNDDDSGREKKHG